MGQTHCSPSQEQRTVQDFITASQAGASHAWRGKFQDHLSPPVRFSTLPLHSHSAQHSLHGIPSSHCCTSSACPSRTDCICCLPSDPPHVVLPHRSYVQPTTTEGVHRRVFTRRAFQRVTCSVTKTSQPPLSFFLLGGQTASIGLTGTALEKILQSSARHQALILFRLY